MMIGKVRGTVVSSTKHSSLTGLKLLAVQPLDPATLAPQNALEVVADAARAGEGDVVMCVRGSSARNTPEMKDYPVDFSAVAVLDTIEIAGETVYRK